MAIFEYRTARDMLDKARREYERFQNDSSLDHVFNFFVTAYHISDYIRETGAVKQAVLDGFLNDQRIKECRDLCHAGKHLKLSKHPDPTTHKLSGCFNGAPFNTLPFNSGDKWILITNSGQIDVKLLANDVLKKWDDFFIANGL